LVSVVELGTHRVGRTHCRAIRGDCGESGQWLTETARAEIHCPPANGAITADGCSSICSQHRGRISPDVAYLVPNGFCAEL